MEEVTYLNFRKNLRSFMKQVNDEADAWTGTFET